MRITHLIVGLLCTALLLPLAACYRPDPTYRLADLTSNAALVGDWENADESQARFVVTITQEQHPTADGRLIRRSTDPNDAMFKQPDQATVYHIRGDIPVSDNYPAAKLTMRAYLLKGDCYTLAGMQLESLTDPAGKKFPFLDTFSFPQHVYARLDHDAEKDTITIRLPRVGITLVPGTEFIDEAPAPPDGRSAAVERHMAREGEIGRLTLVSTNADRVLQVYRRYGDREDFWQETGVTLRRVMAKPAESPK